MIVVVCVLNASLPKLFAYYAKCKVYPVILVPHTAREKSSKYQNWILVSLCKGVGCFGWILWCRKQWDDMSQRCYRSCYWISGQARRPAEFKHIIKRRKRN